MGMEISARRLQEADSRAQQAERESPGGAPGAGVRERFDRAMEDPRDSSGQHGDEGGEGRQQQEEAAPSPQVLLDSLFGSRMQGLQTSGVQVGIPSVPGEMDALVDELVERILVSEPGKGLPEVRITLGQGALPGAELCLARVQDGQLFVRLSCADPASFQTAVGARDALREALERGGENVRVEIVDAQAESGGEGDASRQSRGRQEYVPDAG